MKILFVFPHFLTPGGAANSITLLAKELSKNNIQCEFLCAKASIQFKKDNPTLNIKTLNIPASNSLLYWLFLPFWQIKINKELRSYADFLLFPQVLPSNWWVWIYKKCYPNSQKVLWYCQEPSAFIHSMKWINSLKPFYIKFLAKILRPLLSRVDIFLEKSNDYVFCNSKFTAISYTKIYKKECTDILYPSITLPVIEIPLIKEKAIFTISHLSLFKNIHHLINAFANISNAYPDYNLIIAGEGEARDDLMKLAESKNLGNKISFTGKISNKKREALYRKAKVTVICAENEPFGLVPVESMSYGTPVIAHNSGGPLETTEHTKSGFLYNNQKDLEKYLIKILQMSKSDYNEMSRNAQKKSVNFSTKSVSTNFITILNALK